MNIILGASGHVGGAVARALLRANQPVFAVLHNASKSEEWEALGAKTAAVDVCDTHALHAIFNKGKNVFLLNPPASPATDTDYEERHSLESILLALRDSRIEHIVAESTYGAQRGKQLGDLGVLYEMEQALALQPISFTIVRAAYYMSNWDASLASAQDEGKIYSFFPTTFELPMVAPEDLGKFAALLMTEPKLRSGTYHLEGPKRYCADDIANAFATVVGKPTRAVEIPQSDWMASLKKRGFSNAAATSFSAMTAATLKAHFPKVTEHGPTSIEVYLQEKKLQHTL